jgi:hypothetical protein
MKLLSCLLLTFTLAIPPLYSQTSGNHSMKSEINIEKYGTLFRVKLLGSTTIGPKPDRDYGNGYGMGVSLQFLNGSAVNFYSEFNYGKIKYVEYEKEVPNPPVLFDGMINFYSLGAGVKIYPKVTVFDGYIKTGIIIPYRKYSKTKKSYYTVPMLDLGFGYDFWLSKKINIYSEVEFHTIGSSNSEFSLSIGVSYLL